MIAKFQVYLFDIDGTLLDSAPDICGAQREVLAAAGCGEVSMEWLRARIGLELRAVFCELIPGLTQEGLKHLSEQYTLNYRARKNAGTRVYPGVEETLAALTGRKSTATTKSTAGTRLVLDHFGLTHNFDHIQGSDGIRPKPAPDVVVAAMRALGARPEECLLIGDSPADMEAGRSAGVKICAVQYGYGDNGDLAKWEPDFVVSDLRELVG